MKKINLKKALILTFFIGVLLTWLVPIGGFQEDGFLLLKTDPLGFFDIIRVPLATLANFIHYGMLILSIGGLYGVINKTGVYSKVINLITKKHKKEKLLIFISIILILLSSLIGLNLLLFVLVPFLGTILLVLNYDKITVLSATIGSILVGSLGALYSASVTGPIKQFFDLLLHSEIIAKVIFLIIISFLYINYVLTNSKETKNEKIPFYNKLEQNKNIWPLIIVFSFTFLFLIIAMYDWQSLFNIKFFDQIHTILMKTESNSYPIIANVIGSINPLGRWSVYDLTIILIIVSVVIAWLYSFRMNDFLTSFQDGMKEIFPVAIYLVMANILFSIIYTGQSGAHVFNTIANFFLSIKNKFMFGTMAITSGIGTLFFNDFNQLVMVISNAVNSIYNNSLVYPAISLTIQYISGLVAFIAPTSLLLVAGLTYFKVSYKEWLLYIWKILLKILIIIIIVIVIIMMFV